MKSVLNSRSLGIDVLEFTCGPIQRPVEQGDEIQR